MIVTMLAVKRHIISVQKQVEDSEPLKLDRIRDPLIVLPVDKWNKITEKGLKFAMSLSQDILAVHVDYSEESADITRAWPRLVEDPVKAAGRKPPELVVIKSPYRFVITPLVDYVLEVSERYPDRVIAVLVPELVERHWYHYPLHNQRAQALKALLLVRGNQRVITMNVPWYLKE
jgi:hypothetical protein